ncbi:MAG: hypothetical protein V6Z86_04420 [Hyphomicrobiales bacterium]
MVAIAVVAGRPPASFFVARQILHRLGYAPQSDEERSVLHLIRPFMGARDGIAKLSLTDGMESGEQLRFFLVDRLRRRVSWFSQ